MVTAPVLVFSKPKRRPPRRAPKASGLVRKVARLEQIRPIACELLEGLIDDLLAEEEP